MITSRSVLKKYVIDNLRSTALQLENQDSLLESVLSKKVCDIIDKTKVKKLSVNEFAIHSSSCKGKACSVAKYQECYKLNSRIRNNLRENYLKKVKHFRILILGLILFVKIHLLLRKKSRDLEMKPRFIEENW